ncbi:hypothetical protein N2152v2_008451 [Parachlorella kessleri]
MSDKRIEAQKDPVDEAQDVVNDASELLDTTVVRPVSRALETAERMIAGAGQAEAQGVAQGPAPLPDEVDATPDEQMGRHPVRWEERKAPGALHQVKETVVHAAEGVAHRVEGVAERLHLTHHSQQAGQEGAGGEPLHMAKTAEGRNKGASGAQEEEEEEGPAPKHDEVDASPEEQFVRHHIKWPDEQGAASAARPRSQLESTAGTAQHPSTLQRVRETVVNAAEGVTHRLGGVAERLHLVGGQGSHAEGQQQYQPAVPASTKVDTATPAVPEGTAEQRTGEPLHMAKAAEGRNVARDDPVVHAVHAALRADPQERAAVVSSGEVSSFPETLEDAIRAAQVKGEEPGPPPTSTAAGGTEVDAGDAPDINPFVEGPRSRL